jgi:hypothetical protein
MTNADKDVEKKGSWQRLQDRISIEDSDTEYMCLPNSFLFAIEDLLNHDLEKLELIDFESIKNIRKEQYKYDSDHQRKLRDARRECQSGTVQYLITEAEDQIIEAMLKEVFEKTGVRISWSREQFLSDQIDELRNVATMPNTVGILLTPAHAELLFPQRSHVELAQKLKRGECFSDGNIILLKREEIISGF